MTTLSEIREAADWRDLLEGQAQHAAFAILMTVGACALLQNSADAPQLLGLSATGWAKLSIALAVAHQIIVAVVFRLQLYHNVMTRLFGSHDMRVWAAIFLPLLVVRPVTMILTGWADSMPIGPYFPAQFTLGLALVGVAIWGMHSVLVHFTLPRALGGDHFRDKYLTMPPVTGGVFNYTSNGMYGVVFLGLWGIALMFGSWNALVLALFQHAYIWVHMYCTEAPDMRRLYS